MTRKVHCKKYQQEMEGLEFPPYPGELGQKIFDSISKQAWSEWQGHQTMLINEYRLNLMEKESRSFLEQEMQKFLFEGKDVKPEEYVAPDKKNT